MITSFVDARSFKKKKKKKSPEKWEETQLAILSEAKVFQVGYMNIPRAIKNKRSNMKL